jgi:hypothetical protein
MVGCHLTMILGSLGSLTVVILLAACTKFHLFFERSVTHKEPRKVPDLNANTSEPDKATKKHRYLKDRVEKSWFARFVDILEYLVSWLR